MKAPSPEPWPKAMTSSCSSATCSISRSSTSTATRSSASTTSDLVWENAAGEDEGTALRIQEVEIGLRGAVRRLLKGLPASAVEGLATHFRSNAIPWEFVDLIDRDPARRVRLKIDGDRLSKMHPSDIADILEELAPSERHALFSSLDEEVAAEALEEVEPKMQQALIESLDSETVAGIVEEMDPGAAADLLSELSDDAPKPSSKRWTPKNATRSKTSSSSPATPPPVG